MPASSMGGIAVSGAADTPWPAGGLRAGIARSEP